MEEKKEGTKIVNFFKDVSEKFKSLEPNRKKLLIIISIVVLALIIISIITSIMLYSSTSGAGKIAGNLNNAGFAIEKSGKAYVSSTLINSDENGLYEISSDNTATLIATDEYVKSINVYKGKIYYLAINQDDSGNYIRSIVKMKSNGEDKEILVDNIETTSIGNDSLNVSDGWIYYLNGDSKLEKIKTNGEKRQQVSDEEIECFQISGKYIYYTTKDDDFKRMKKDGSAVEKFENGIETFQIVNDDVYYISKSNYYLMKYNIKDNTDTEVISRKIKTFNIYKKTIYYAVNENDEQAIYKIKLNGKNNEKVVDLDSSNVYICIVGKWIYYTDKQEDSPYYYTIYRVKTNGEGKERVNI